MTASRLIAEKYAKQWTGNWDAKWTPDAKIAAIWTTLATGALKPPMLEAAIADENVSVRTNAALVAEAARLGQQVVSLLNDPDAHVRLAALRALGAQPISDEIARAIVDAWPKFDDDYQRSAAVGAAAQNPIASIVSALDSSNAAAVAPLVTELSQDISSADDATKLVIALAAKPAGVDPIKIAVLDALSRNLKNPPPLTPELSTALTSLLASGASASALPLAAKWDKAGTLKSEITKLIGRLALTLSDTKASDQARINAAQSLIGLSSEVDGVLSTLTKQLSAQGSSEFKRALIGSLAEINETPVGTAIATVYDNLPPDVQPAAFDALLKRADWANAFLEAIQAKKVNAANLGPATSFRLRSYPNQVVAKRATEILDQLNPMVAAKKEAIAKLAPIVEQPGNPETGKALFTATCAICHKFDGAGADIGPGLTGMGSHGAGELLGAIVDPNAEVDPSFVTWNIEAKDGQIYSGVITAENPSSITLKSLAGLQEVKTANIKSRVNTGRSLMPEGFDGLGGEPLRDIIAYMQSVDGGNFRTLDLRDAFTANTSRSMYLAPKPDFETLRFAKTGTVQVEGIPFNIVPPGKVPNNAIVLKGGPVDAYSRTFSQRVEVPVGNFKANRLHFLGGVAGWGYPYGREGETVMKVTVEFAGGAKETFDLKNGVEFADYIREVAVPGSKLTEGLVEGHQLRWFTKTLEHTAPIQKIILESPGGEVAPTTLAITAELADPNTSKPTAAAATKASATAAVAPKDEDADFKPQFNDPVPQPPAERPAKGPRVLLVGGGSSHDFVKFFGETDKATLADVAGWVDFTQNANGVPEILDRVDVLVWSANQPVSSKTRKALIEFANSGKGIIPFHPGTWYAWNDFPQWNKEVVGGGTRGHDALGPFEVKKTSATHPVTENVSPLFPIIDELYNYQIDPSGNPIEVLATATSPKSGKEFPQVFIVQHPKSRIVGITLGHDARAHDQPDFQKILKQAVVWAGGK